MKNAMFLAVASAILMAGGACAEQNLVADVPFGFTASTLELAAGQYQLRMGDPIPQAYVQLRHMATHKAVFVRALNPEYVREESKPRLVFRCVNGRCALDQIWTASSTGYRFAAPKAPKGAKIQLATVYLHRASNAD